MRRRTASSRLISSAALSLLALGLAQPAAAHPFGPPPVAKVTADGATVTVNWSAQPDDLFALAQATGTLIGEQVFVYQDGVPVPSAEDTPSIRQQLIGSDEIQEYLGSHITVGEAGASCRLQDVVTQELFTTGARLTYTCPRPARTLELEITALTDIDASYRTVGLGAGGARSLHTAEAPSQPLAVAASTGEVAAGIPVTLVVGIGVTAIVAAAAVALRRRRRQVPARR